MPVFSAIQIISHFSSSIEYAPMSKYLYKSHWLLCYTSDQFLHLIRTFLHEAYIAGFIFRLTNVALGAMNILKEKTFLEAS